MARATKTGKDDNRKKHSKSRKQDSPKKKDQGHHFRCLPKTVATMYNECLRKNDEKIALIEELGFDHNKKDRQGVRSFMERDPFDERVSEKDLNDEDYAIFKIFQGKSQADLTMLVKRTPIDIEANRNLFKRAFLIFIQKVFLLATSSLNVTPKALPTLFGLENTRERNWALHVHDFLLDEVKKAKLNKTKAVHGCCYVMMIIYFHETHFGKDSREPEAQPPWIQYWTGENLRKKLHREQNNSTEQASFTHMRERQPGSHAYAWHTSPRPFPEIRGLVQTGLLRAAKEKLQKRNMDLKMGLNLRIREPSSSSESKSEFDSEEEYESEVESSSGGASTELDSKNTMSEELVERRPLSKPNPAQQEKRSKKKHESNATGGARSVDRPLVDSIRRPAPIMHQETAALGKRKQPDRAAKAKRLFNSLWH
ncbi:hypothetical protein PIB30_057643 [Stylosanthes scabra]|uniref:Uncharacterized protein n=1 Tax=Stylosanthes scabra TaxID=79078 RepID=A0ABU6WLP2_9FABA|nr:hypothetical protein [Stylosanthes scabra]